MVPDPLSPVTGTKAVKTKKHEISFINRIAHAIIKKETHLAPRDLKRVPDQILRVREPVRHLHHDVRVRVRLVVEQVENNRRLERFFALFALELKLFNARSCR